MRSILALVCSAMLSACTLPYVPPTTGPTAKLRLYAPSGGLPTNSVMLYTLGDGQCGDARKVRAIGGIQLGGIYGGELDIGMLKDEATKADQGRYFEIVVPAEKQFYFNVRGAHANTICDVTQSFTPQEDGQYEVIFIKYPNGCATRLTRLQLKEDSVLKEPETSWKKNPKTCSTYGN